MLKSDDYWVNKDGKTFQLLHFDRPIDIVKKVEELISQGKESYTNGELNRGENNWTYGNDFKNSEMTSYAINKGDISKNLVNKILEKKSKFLELQSVQALLQKAKSSKRKRIYKDEGSELCIDRILCGDSNHWSVLTRGKKNNLVTLAINYAVSSGSNENDFVEMASLIAVSTEIIASAGFGIQVLALGSVHNITNKIQEGGICFPLKKANEVLDIRKIACVGIPGLLRAYTFDIWSNLLRGTPASGLGQCFSTTQEIKDRLNIQYLFEKKWETEQDQVTIIDNLFKSLIN